MVFVYGGGLISLKDLSSLVLNLKLMEMFVTTRVTLLRDRLQILLPLY